MATEVVWVTGDLAAPPRAGGEIRTAHLMRHLAARTSLDLILLAHHADQEAVTELVAPRRLVHRPPPKAPVRKRARALLLGLPVAAAGRFDPAVAKDVRARAGEGAVVVVDHVIAAPYVRGIPRSVLNLQNDDAALLRQLPADGLRRRLERAWDMPMTTKLQREVVLGAGLVTCVSEQDIATVGRADALLVPNGTDVPDLGELTQPGEDIVFVGSLGYAPNEDAVRWWLEHIADLLPAELPPLTVVGRDADRALADLAGDRRLRICSNVPDVAPYLHAARVVVQPIRLGSGSRLKVLEALAFARPLVATTKAVEGFPVRDGHQALLADEPEAFAAAVTRAYREASLAQELAGSGRALAESYAWGPIADRFAEAVLQRFAV